MPPARGHARATSVPVPSLTLISYYQSVGETRLVSLTGLRDRSLNVPQIALAMKSKSRIPHQRLGRVRPVRARYASGLRVRTNSEHHLELARQHTAGHNTRVPTVLSYAITGGRCSRSSHTSAIGGALAVRKTASKEYQFESCTVRVPECRILERKFESCLVTGT